MSRGVGIPNPSRGPQAVWRGADAGRVGPCAAQSAVARMGYAAAAERVQQFFLAGQRGEGIEVVPDALADEIVLCGPPARIRESLMAWRATPVATPVVMTRDPTVLRLLAEATSRG